MISISLELYTILCIGTGLFAGILAGLAYREIP